MSAEQKYRGRVSEAIRSALDVRGVELTWEDIDAATEAVFKALGGFSVPM